jgi:hypothetical protein
MLMGLMLVQHRQEGVNYYQKIVLKRVKVKKGVVLLFPLSGIGDEIIITLEVVGFMLLSNEGDAHDKSLTMLLSVTVV